MNTPTLQFSDVPRDWALCFQHDCPLVAFCLRHHAATLAPADLRKHNCVLPGARTGDGRCALFVEDKPVRMARGMETMLRGWSQWDAMPVRHALEGVFGSRAQYYRYRSGRWPVTPHQQQRVAAVFRRYGITAEPHYDRITEEYFFPRD